MRANLVVFVLVGSLLEACAAADPSALASAYAPSDSGLTIDGSPSPDGSARASDGWPADGAPADDAGSTDALSSADGALAASDASAPDAGGVGTSDGAVGDAGGSSEGGAPGVGLHVSGPQILDRTGTPVRLLGVNRSGSEYACIHGTGFFDGPVDQASVDAIKSWKANAVRVPLNEDCWLAINGAPAQYSGVAYQKAISDFVDLLLGNGIYPIIELHWSAPGAQKATGQLAMPDRDHSVAFWSQVAAAFSSRSDVVLELFNEPYPDGNMDTATAWTCWRDGGTCSGLAYQAAGMQELLTAARAAGAGNLILLGGVQYSNALSQWLAYKPADPAANIAAAWHVYNFNGCSSTPCYDTAVGPLAAKVPIVATEIGENDCAGGFITTLMAWLDQHGMSYLGWTWDAWGGCLVLVTDYKGTPAGRYGQTYKNHLLATPH